ncbi:hypothetical protein Cni_G28197 [Canna indica]|uniref:Uncharacterized protein n=1 Tax=Canna indica TaxID=4628 RepID=A0AAQ3L2K3_9LILI|nr:hypothetical protein Cni_G28197 [Canna indica]
MTKYLDMLLGIRNNPLKNFKVNSATCFTIILTIEVRWRQKPKGNKHNVLPTFDSRFTVEAELEETYVPPKIDKLKITLEPTAYYLTTLKPPNHPCVMISNLQQRSFQKT